MAHILIQTWRWMMQPKVWRFVGFASSAIGLLCYALSSSFNYLFGDWNLLKIILYSIFSFIISLVVLFARMWQNSRSLRFKAHAAFLVLTITSLYSFFFDKVVNGKPDAYSLISCASFSIMLMSLSRQTQCGFEVDFLYFFLGCLIVQLMKIKLQLFIVGAGFSYFVIILRSSFSSIDFVIDNEHPTGLENESRIVIEVHLQSPQLGSTDIGSSMVEQLSNYMKALQEENSNLIEMLLEKLKEYCNDDSRFNVSDPDLMIKALPTETVDNIHKTAKLMVSAGFEKHFSDMYISCRRECLVESLSRLGLKKHNVEDVQMLSWKELEEEIERWIKTSNVALKILFPTERKLCDRVLFGFSSTADLSFTDVCRESTLQLLNFADAIANGSRSPERLFRVIDMFETLCDLIPEFKSVFRDQYTGSLQNKATTIWKRLGEAVGGIFKELANLIRQDPAKAAVPAVGLHPITHYVMNYLHADCQSRKVLEREFEEDYGYPLNEYPKIEDRVHSTSSLSVKMGLIMELLESSLEAKSKIYEDPTSVLCFPDELQQLEKNGSISHNGVTKSVKEKLKSFNVVFDDLCWVPSS
ncbi:putative exocyst complex component Exo70, cullin repeat-like-containing domain-containing protein [Medicago truncatula]|uniref:Exocyst subunit Exo70 family protein n=1 Tax=Medicago truncatula TaxID=3880 RepID=A0A396HTI3_MEDTR|nr:putative exocyst complex component Exo70, cullin repeat-like-containing domain-containing protein [Medicago truncatula]